MSIFLSPESNIGDGKCISPPNPQFNMKNKSRGITKKNLLTIVWRISKLWCLPTLNLNIEKYSKSLKLLSNFKSDFYIYISQRGV